MAKTEHTSKLISPHVFAVKIIEPGSYSIRIDGFQFHHETDMSRAERIVKLLNDAFKVGLSS